ncbi:long-chain fatty acid--CoA ligase [Treponema parvum]|uniref:Long-chain fatty acid--CoA ligase n=1 Tax=Treponema parvum TaxID=138851 RepID=A0A975F661_9SPIR|nr:long-chain fatty acid--CoA ligase [Treponema parvum]QTQ15018.1 long-chain fatty acid--CoA ligase [Treponema parvum]
MEQTLVKMIRNTVRLYPEVPVQYSRNLSGNFEPVTYKDLFEKAMNFAGALLSLGSKRGDRIGIISDNRKEWQLCDIGIMAIGAIDVPRGCDATIKDLEYILSFTECSIVIAENQAQIKKILSIKANLPNLQKLICFERVPEAEISEAQKGNIEILNFESVLSEGKIFCQNNENLIETEIEKGVWDETVSIIFTSGTTGTPKGVMLSNGNFLAQLDELPERIYLNPGDRALCVLPIWHAFQRLCEYVVFIQAAAICYSKPLGSILIEDFKKLNPHIMPAVPRIFEAVYEGITRKMRKTGGFVYVLFKFFTAVAVIHSRIDRKLFRKTARFTKDNLGFWWAVLVLPWLILYPVKLLGAGLIFSKIKAMLGKNFRAGVAGGAAYPVAVDEFFWAIGVNIVEGYGLTETAPVVAVRPMADPVFRTIGRAIRGVQVRIVDPNGMILGRCQKGVLQVKGKTVMKGYYKRGDLTEKVISKDGWLDTGDIAIFTLDDEIQLRGRMKDTIVLRGGENIEPLPIEMKLTESRFITSAVVVGQDQRFLAALIVPNKTELKEWTEENGIQYDTFENFMNSEEVKKLFETEIANAINAQNGFRLFEKVNKFTLLNKEFEVGVELSAKQEIMRYRLNEIYAKEINAMFK